PGDTNGQTGPASVQERTAAARTRRWVPRLGIGSRLALGLIAMAAVIVVGHTLARQTTSAAVDAVPSMQQEHGPPARRAGLVLEQLLAYDRAVSEYVEAGRPLDVASIDAARDALANAIAEYFEGTPRPVLGDASTRLRAQIAEHVERGRKLATEAHERSE